MTPDGTSVLAARLVSRFLKQCASRNVPLFGAVSATPVPLLFMDRRARGCCSSKIGAEGARKRAAEAIRKADRAGFPIFRPGANGALHGRPVFLLLGS